MCGDQLDEVRWPHPLQPGSRVAECDEGGDSLRTSGAGMAQWVLRYPNTDTTADGSVGSSERESQLMMNGHIKYSFIHYRLVLLIVIVWRYLEALIVPYILAGMLHGRLWNEWNSTNVIFYKFYFKLCHLSSLLYIVLEYLSLRIIKWSWL